MEVGKLRDRVQIQTRTAKTDAAGNADNTWVDVAKAWAQVSPMSGDEAQRAGHTEATVMHQVRMRFRSDLPTRKAKDRIVFDGRVLNIVAVRNLDEGRDELVLNCVEVVT